MGENRAIRILIVDDEPFIGDLLGRYLTSDGYNCRVVSSGEEAIKVDSNPPRSISFWRTS